MSFKLKTISAMLCFGVLSACSGNVKDTLGLKKEAPDEFKVVSNQPLSVPPDFRLIQPSPGAKRPQVVDLDKQAETLVFGDTSAQNSSQNSSGESALLARANTAAADPSIREILTQEEQEIRVIEEEKGFFSKVSDLFRNKEEDPELNPSAEKKRIHDAQKSGEEITGDDTALEEKKNTGVLGRIFNF